MAKRNYEQKNGKTSPRRRKKDSFNEADWGVVDEGILRELVRIVTRTGGAIRFGYTRDGGTYAVGLYDDGDSWPEYCNNPEDVEQWLIGIGEEWGD